MTTLSSPPVLTAVHSLPLNLFFSVILATHALPEDRGSLDAHLCQHARMACGLVRGSL